MVSNGFKSDSFNSLGRQEQRQQAAKQGRDTAGLPMMKMTQKAFIPSVPPTRSKGIPHSHAKRGIKWDGSHYNSGLEQSDEGEGEPEPFPVYGMETKVQMEHIQLDQVREEVILL